MGRWQDREEVGGFLPFTFSLAGKAFPKYQVTITERAEQYTWFDKAAGENDHELVIVIPRLSSLMNDSPLF